MWRRVRAAKGNPQSEVLKLGTIKKSDFGQMKVKSMEANILNGVE
jgi:hypothetical protein